MMDFIEEKLLEYNDKKRNAIKSKIDEICKNVENLNENINGLYVLDNRKCILHRARKTGYLLKIASDMYYTWLSVQLDLGILSQDEYDDLNVNAIDLNKEQKFWKICHLKSDMYDELIEQRKWYPKKNTREYCECKGYWDMSRIEIGKHIKEELSSEYPEIKFSVTTKAEKYCRDEVHIDIVEIPKRFVEKSTIYGSEYSITQEFRMELRGFVEEFEPRVSVFIGGRFLNKSRINWRDI